MGQSVPLLALDRAPMIDWQYIKQEIGELLRLLGFLLLLLFAFIGLWHVLSLIGV